MLTYLSVMIRSFFADDEGASAIEYGLIAALIAAVLVTVLTLVGGDLTSTFQGVADALPGGDSDGGGDTTSG